ncbi:hypothetical protein ACHAXA_009863, partial [Cyclostephanos tholiformis]
TTEYAGEGGGRGGDNREWMVISGGFADSKWDDFPVWAYDLSRNRRRGGERSDNGDVEDDGEDDASTPYWTDLTTGASSSSTTSKSSYPAGLPRGRVGHLSSVYRGCLYVFGGFTYALGTFRVADYVPSTSNGGSNTLAIWKACGLDDALLDGVGSRSRDGTRGDANNSTRMEGEGKEDGGGGSRSRSSSVESWVIRRTLCRVARLGGGITTPVTTIAIVIGDNIDDRDEHDDQDYFVFHGGMHNYPSLGASSSSGGGMSVLGDVWRYDYASETLMLLSPYPPLLWQRDERNGNYPVARTTHAGTIVGCELIIHGGMHFGEEDDRMPSSSSSSSSFAAPSTSYASYRTSLRWRSLSDVWAFDLVTLKWKERVMYPQLARSYHSLVGWDDGTIAAFGGFQQNNDIPGETVAFVFNDLILSRHNETYWRKSLTPYDVQVPHFRASSEHSARQSITNRLEHSAVLDRYGSMYIWGGRFQTASQITGLWRLDVFTEDSKLMYAIAPPDGIEQYEAELQMLHTFIAMMMFMSLALSSMLSMMRRQGLTEAGGGDGGGRGGGTFSLTSSRRGLSRDVIDSLPLKRYTAERNDNTDRLENDSECCPICLVDFSDGIEIRTLPCGHYYHWECVDSWLCDRTTCPTCRENIDNTEEEEEEEAMTNTTTTIASNVFLTQHQLFPSWLFVGASNMAGDGETVGEVSHRQRSIPKSAFDLTTMKCRTITRKNRQDGNVSPT